MKAKSTSQVVIAPIIAGVIRDKYRETEAFVTRAEIAAGLIAHNEARPFLQEAHQNTAGHYTFEEYVGNQVDFFSKGITEDTSEYGRLFEQQRIDGNWAYRPL